MKDKADRFNEGKLKWSLVDFKSIEPLVQVLMFGARKYAPDNWKRGLDKKEILESMMRHLTAIIDGEILDLESGLPHTGHIMCNCMFWNYFNKDTMSDGNFQNPNQDVELITGEEAIQVVEDICDCISRIHNDADLGAMIRRKFQVQKEELEKEMD